MTRIRLASLVSLALPFATLPAHADVLYVDAELDTGSNDGSSWADAYQGSLGLRDALLVADPGDRVFVREGTYHPSEVRTEALVLESGVEIYGGFAGGESSPDERPPFGVAPSVIDGNIGDPVFYDDSQTLVRSGTADVTAILDGFTLARGRADGGGGFAGNGGAIYCEATSSPTIRNCAFQDNFAIYGGGAVFAVGSSPRISDCHFEGNVTYGGGAIRFLGTHRGVVERCTFHANSGSGGSALSLREATESVIQDCLITGNEQGKGGAILLAYSTSVEIRNCTIVGNESKQEKVGGIRSSSTVAANILITNTILWGNLGTDGQEDNHDLTGPATVSYSIVPSGTGGVGNLDLDPLFQDAANGDYTLTLASPAIDAGDNAVRDPLDIDLASRPRMADELAVADTGNGAAPIVDMGALERSIGIVDHGCVPLANSTGSVAVLSATGSDAVADNDLTLVVHHLPLQQFGYFLVSDATDSIPVDSGVLCLGAPQLRFDQDVLNTGLAGAVAFSPDLVDLPQGQAVQPGETWAFQLWFRDGASSNFSSSLVFTWQ